MPEIVRGSFQFSHSCACATKMSSSSMSYSGEKGSPPNTGKHLGNLQDAYHSDSSSVDIRGTQELRGSSPYGAVFIVVNAALGAGLLTFPYAFYLAGGWYGGLILQLVSYGIPCMCVQTVSSNFSVQCFLPIALAGLMILAYCAELHQASSYEAMIEGMFGSIAKGIVELFVAVYCFGSCLTYLVVIGDQIVDSEFQ